MLLKCSSEGSATDLVLSSTPVRLLTVDLDSIFKKGRYDASISTINEY